MQAASNGAKRGFSEEVAAGIVQPQNKTLAIAALDVDVEARCRSGLCCNTARGVPPAIFVASVKELLCGWSVSFGRDKVEARIARVPTESNSAPNQQGQCSPRAARPCVS